MIRAPSTGYQPHFHASGDKIYYVWHEYGGPFRQIFTAEMNIDGTGWRAERGTCGLGLRAFLKRDVTGSLSFLALSHISG